MDSTVIEGFTGVYIHDITFFNDIMLVIVIILLSVFAWLFRLNPTLFSKMISNISANERRQSIFVTSEKDSFFFNIFMTFQALFLLSAFLFAVAVKYKFLSINDFNAFFLYVLFLGVLFFTFFLFKRVLYILFGTVFFEKHTYKMMLTNYQTLFCTWGITLYIPVLWVLLFNTHILIPFIIFVISLLAFKIIHALRIIYIFFYKNTGLLFISLYLCAQEIVPLVLLYKGMVYMYNIIENNNTWQ
jgi:hypothetical protein